MELKDTDAFNAKKKEWVILIDSAIMDLEKSGVD
jgi:hypothetical protein